VDIVDVVDVVDLDIVDIVDPGLPDGGIMGAAR